MSSKRWWYFKSSSFNLSSHLFGTIELRQLYENLRASQEWRLTDRGQLSTTAIRDGRCCISSRNPNTERHRLAIVISQAFSIKDREGADLSVLVVDLLFDTVVSTNSAIVRLN